MNENYTIATRGSKLALIQTEIVSNSLRSIFPSTNCDIIKIKSMGDIQRNKFLFSVNEKGIFEKLLILMQSFNNRSIDD